MKLEQAARALLEHWDTPAWKYVKHTGDLMADLREALAEQAQQKIDDGVMLASMLHPHNCCVLVDDISEDSIEQVEQAEWEPVAWGMRASNGAFFTITPEEHDNNGEGLHNIPLYAAPVRTKDLTDDEIWKANKTELPDCQDLVDFARAVIAADRKKNRA